MPVERPETIRRTREEDIPALSELFREVFGQERSAALWRWKYFDHPGGLFSYVCEASGRLVAHCGGTPVRFNDRGREITALQSVDFMSSSRYPGGVGGGGVFVRLVRAFFADYCESGRAPLVYGFPGERHRLLGERLLGYRPVEAVGELVLPPSESGLAPSKLSVAALRDFIRVPTPAGVVRDASYLSWRYLHHPVHQYGVVEGRRWFRSRMSSIVRDDGEAVRVMEIGGEVTAASTAALTRQLRRLGKPVKMWTSLAHPMAQLMIAAGFEAMPRDHQIEFRFFDGRPPFQPGDVDFTLGDYDVY